MLVREVQMSGKNFTSRIIDKVSYEKEFSSIEELFAFIEEKGKVGIIEIYPDGPRLMTVDPTKDLY